MGGTQGNKFSDFGNPTKESPRSYHSYGGGQSSQYPGVGMKLGGGISVGATISSTRTGVPGLDLR